MKKILNLTRNEMADIESEERVVFDPPRKYALLTEHEQITYKLTKDKPSHWKDTDNYKVVEV